MQLSERYLRLLADKFPNSNAVRTEIINLSAILSLPKGTEHFVSDLHGESSAFIHMIKNASGVVRRKVDDIYGDTLSEVEKRALCALIYYPDERIDLVKRMYAGEDSPETRTLTCQALGYPYAGRVVPLSVASGGGGSPCRNGQVLALQGAQAAAPPV